MFLSRSTFRESLEHLGRSSNWVGSILRLFLKKYPVPYPVYSRSPLERAIEVYGESGFAEYLRSKGFKVVKPMSITDSAVIDFLESKGYVIAGLLDDVYYETGIDRKSTTLEEKRSV